MENPAEFSKHNKNTTRDAEELLLKFRDYFRWPSEEGGSEDVLEVGCADGTITARVVRPFLGNHVRKLIGSDVSETAIAVAREAHGSEPDLHFEVMDIAEEEVWKRHEKEFGKIVSFYTFHLVGWPERWSKNVYEMLKPNGQFFAVMVLPPHPFPLAMKAQRLEKDSRWAQYLEKCPDLFYDFGENPIDTIKGILTNAGFKIEVAESVSLRSVYQNFDSLAATGLAVNNIQKHIPEELKSDYVADFLKKIRANVQEGEDGSFFYDKNTLVLMATKP